MYFKSNKRWLVLFFSAIFSMSVYSFQKNGADNISYAQDMLKHGSDTENIVFVLDSDCVSGVIKTMSLYFNNTKKESFSYKAVSCIRRENRNTNELEIAIHPNNFEVYIYSIKDKTIRVKKY